MHRRFPQLIGLRRDQDDIRRNGDQSPVWVSVVLRSIFASHLEHFGRESGSRCEFRNRPMQNIRFQVNTPDLRPAIIFDQVTDATIQNLSVAIHGQQADAGHCSTCASSGVEPSCNSKE